MRTINLCTLVIPLSILLSCEDLDTVIPTYDGYHAQLQTYVGQSVNVVVQDLGAPTRTVDLAQGSKSYIWEQRSDLHTPVVGRSSIDRATGDETVVIDGGDRVPLDCVTELDVDKAGLVYGFRSKGLACLGRAPGSATESEAATQQDAVPAEAEETTGTKRRRRAGKGKRKAQ